MQVPQEVTVMLDAFDRALCCFNRVAPSDQDKRIDSNDLNLKFGFGEVLKLDPSILDESQVDAAFPSFVVSLLL